MNEQFSRELREFILGLLGSSGDASAAAQVSQPYETASQSYIGGYPGSSGARPDASSVVVAMNVSSKLSSGQLLLTLQYDGRIYRYDQNTQETEIVCGFFNSPMVLWSAAVGKGKEIYVAMSGGRMANPKNPFEVLFGLSGGILRVDTANEAYAVLPGTTELQDPSHIIVLGDGSLLVCDFEGFGGTGSLYELEPNSGVRRKIVTGEPLRDPCCAIIGDDGYIYVANPRQSYAFRKGPGDKWLKDWGSIIRIDRNTGLMKTIYDEQSNPQGGIVGVKSTGDPRYLLVIRGDWPSMTGSAVLLLDVENGAAEPLIEASASKPRFFGHDAAACIDGLVYIVDSYYKEMLTIDVKSRSVVDTQSMRHILGQTTGMMTSMQTVESVVVIP